MTLKRPAEHVAGNRQPNTERLLPKGSVAFKKLRPPCSAVPLPALTAVICRRLSPPLCDVGLGVCSIKKSLKLRESMVGSTLLVQGASGNYSIHHNYTNRTLPHIGQGTQILP